MNRDRLDLALERLRPAAWERFEQFANRFLAAEFPNLRPVAHPAGDKGRDAFLWQDEGDDSVLLQYSVAEGWDSKIVDTAKTISKNFPEASVLIYVTNQLVAAQADVLRQRLRKDFRLFLDVRDRLWFVDRAESNPGREAAAEALAVDVVDPFLAGRGVIESKGQALTSFEAQAAFVHLALQWEDDSREKGLTKLSYEALVRSVLRESSSEARRTRAEIHEAVSTLVPGHDLALVQRYTDSALHRLTKRYIRHWTKEDEFCLTYDEVVRLRGRLTSLETAENGLRRELARSIRSFAGVLQTKLPDDLDGLVVRVRRVLERALLARGETFVALVRGSTADPFNPKALEALVVTDVGAHPDADGLQGDLILLVTEVVHAALLAPEPNMRHHLHSVADAYTLFAFLCETPDIQAVVAKIFSEGEIWLDASAVLPLFVEELAEPAARTFQNTLLAAREAGLQLRITDGVLEEVEAHLHLSLRFARHRPEEGVWRNRVPFVFASYALTGRAKSAFPGWLETFKGTSRPLDDVAEFLERSFGILLGSLEADAAKASIKLRSIVEGRWRPVHERRFNQSGDVNPDLITRLIRHDVENYVGVIQRRRNQKGSPFGYSTWFLTLDSTAYTIHKEIRDELGHDAPRSPVMSPDFLLSYLSFGPARAKIKRSTEAALPLAVDMAPLDLVPKALLDIAEEIRAELEGLPAAIVDRRVRDALDAARWRLGEVAKGGMSAAMERLKPALIEQARHGSP